jgi:hypothetical protein
MWVAIRASCGLERQEEREELDGGRNIVVEQPVDPNQHKHGWLRGC